MVIGVIKSQSIIISIKRLNFTRAKISICIHWLVGLFQSTKNSICTPVVPWRFFAFWKCDFWRGEFSPRRCRITRNARLQAIHGGHAMTQEFPQLNMLFLMHPAFGVCFSLTDANKLEQNEPCDKQSELLPRCCCCSASAKHDVMIHTQITSVRSSMRRTFARQRCVAGEGDRRSEREKEAREQWEEWFVYFGPIARAFSLPLTAHEGESTHVHCTIRAQNTHSETPK